jgi:predicted Zn-dependent protease
LRLDGKRGITRDGTFLVQDDLVAGGIRNFRFNQSILEMLSKVELLGPAVRAAGRHISCGDVHPPLYLEGTIAC